RASDRVRGKLKLGWGGEARTFFGSPSAVLRPLLFDIVDRNATGCLGRWPWIWAGLLLLREGFGAGGAAAWDGQAGIRGVVRCRSRVALRPGRGGLCSLVGGGGACDGR